jgi:phosphatidylserine decarboxylase
LFGGSDFVMLFQSKVDFKLTVPQESKKTYKHVLMGETYGKLTPIRIVRHWFPCLDGLIA